MIRALRQLSLAALFVAPSIASGLACAENRESIYIAAVLDQSAATDSCNTLTCGASMTFRDHGYLDVRYANHYPAALAVFNQMLERQSKAKAAAESSFVNLEGAEVRLTDAGNNEIVEPFSVPVASFVSPNAGTPSCSPAGVDLVDYHAAQVLAAQLQGTGVIKRVNAHVKVFGTSTGGTALESAEFLYPIDVCWNCLLGFPVMATDSASGTTICPLTDETGNSTFTLTPHCLPYGVDELVDCRYCKMVTPDRPEMCDPPIAPF